VLKPHEIEDCLCIFKGRLAGPKRPRLANSPKLRAILDAAERRIDEGAGMPHDDFWKQAESTKQSRQANGSAKKRKTTPRKKR
jgi:hypothetical protein